MSIKYSIAAMTHFNKNAKELRECTSSSFHLSFIIIFYNLLYKIQYRVLKENGFDNPWIHFSHLKFNI